MAYVAAVTISLDALEAQIGVANNRIIRSARLQMDNEYAEGVRDALSWVAGRVRTAPYAGEPSASVEAA